MRVALLAGPATAFRLAEYSPLDFLSFGGSDSDAATEADVAGASLGAETSLADVLAVEEAKTDLARPARASDIGDSRQTDDLLSASIAETEAQATANEVEAAADDALQKYQQTAQQQVDAADARASVAEQELTATKRELASLKEEMSTLMAKTTDMAADWQTSKKELEAKADHAEDQMEERQAEVENEKSAAKKELEARAAKMELERKQEKAALEEEKSASKKELQAKVAEMELESKQEKADLEREKRADADMARKAEEEKLEMVERAKKAEAQVALLSDSAKSSSAALESSAAARKAAVKAVQAAVATTFGHTKKAELEFAAELQQAAGVIAELKAHLSSSTSSTPSDVLPTTEEKQPPGTVAAAPSAAAGVVVPAAAAGPVTSGADGKEDKKEKVASVFDEDGMGTGFANLKTLSNVLLPAEGASAAAGKADMKTITHEKMEVTPASVVPNGAGSVGAEKVDPPASPAAAVSFLSTEVAGGATATADVGGNLSGINPLSVSSISGVVSTALQRSLGPELEDLHASVASLETHLEQMRAAGKVFEASSEADEEAVGSALRELEVNEATSEENVVDVLRKGMEQVAKEKAEVEGEGLLDAGSGNLDAGKEAEVGEKKPAASATSLFAGILGLGSDSGASSGESKKMEETRSTLTFAVKRNSF